MLTDLSVLPYITHQYREIATVDVTQAPIIMHI